MTKEQIEEIREHAQELHRRYQTKIRLGSAWGDTLKAYMDVVDLCEDVEDLLKVVDED